MIRGDCFYWSRARLEGRSSDSRPQLSKDRRVNLPLIAGQLEERSVGRFRIETPEGAKGHVKAGVSEQSRGNLI